MIEVIQVKDEDAYKEELKIRENVFVIEQGISPDIELDADDKRAIHVLAREEGKAVGCGRIVINDQYGKIGRVAVLSSRRGQGIGKEVCKKLIDIARERGLSKVGLHAQLDVVEFYRSIGFQPIGKVFQEAGIEHMKMELNL